MIQCRTKYDKKFTEEDKKRRALTGFYSLYNGPHEHEKKCQPDVAPRNSKSDVIALDYAGRMSVESALRNLDVPLNKTNQTNNSWMKFKNKLNKTKLNQGTCSGWENNNINSEPTDEYTRFQLPKSNFRELSLLKNHITPYLHINKQKGYSNKMFDRFCNSQVFSRNIARDQFSKKKTGPITEKCK